VDCWSHFAKPLTRVRLKPHQAYVSPRSEVVPVSGTGVIFKKGAPISLNELSAKALQERDPFLIHQVSISATSDKEALSLRVCDSIAKACSNARTIPALSSGKLDYPLYQISEKFLSSGNLVLDPRSGTGISQEIGVSFYLE
jgi:hypothetical protein